MVVRSLNVSARLPLTVSSPQGIDQLLIDSSDGKRLTAMTVTLKL